MAWALAASAAIHFSAVDDWSPGMPRARVEAPAPALEARLAVGLQPEAWEEPHGEAVGHGSAAWPVVPAPHKQAGHETAARDAPVGAEAQPAINPAPASDAHRSFPAPVDTVYFSVRELDDYPAPAHPLRFGYPPHLINAGVAGNVVLDVRLDETGSVDQVAVVAAEPPGHFDEHARASLASARFTPGRREGRAVRSRVTVRVKYDPAAREGVLR